MSAPFSRAVAAHRLGPAAVAAVRALVDAAPPLPVSTRRQVQAVFASAPVADLSATRPLAA
jgi:hypothetical protein